MEKRIAEDFWDRVMKLVAGLIAFSFLVSAGWISLDRKMRGMPTGVFTRLVQVQVFEADSLTNTYIIGHTREDAHKYQFCADFNPAFMQGTKLKYIIFEDRRNCKSVGLPNTGYE